MRKGNIGFCIPIGDDMNEEKVCQYDILLFSIQKYSYTILIGLKDKI
jgi:hypothetical protein